jgi:vacuolar-type H+-ATPase subunit H
VNDDALQHMAAQAIERVLRAERDGQARIDAARRQARSELDAARDDALAIVNRALERSADWQRGHAQALAARLAARRAEAAAATLAEPHAPHDGAIAAAVEQVARRLSGSSP